MKLQKTLVGALAALVTFGLLASCQNAASPAKVKSVKASQLTCAEGTPITADMAETFVQELLGEVTSSIPGLSPKKFSNVGIAKSVLTVSADIVKATAEEEDPFKAIEDAMEKFADDLEKNNTATLNLDETVNLSEVDEESGNLDGKVAVKAKFTVSENVSDDKTKMTASANGYGEAKVNVGFKAANPKESPITQAIVNTTAKAEVKKFSTSVDGEKMLSNPKEAITVKGSAAASDGASAGVAFNVEGIVGKIIANVKVSAKLESDQLTTLVESASSGNLEAVEKIAEDMLTLEFDVEVYTPTDEKVFSKSFDSVKTMEEWIVARK